MIELTYVDTPSGPKMVVARDIKSELMRQLAEKERELAELEKKEQELINKLVSYGFDEQVLKKMLEKLDADLNLESQEENA